MKIGELFTAAHVDTQPCIHCGAPAADCDGRTLHFEVADTGAKTASLECHTVVRGRRKHTGTMAALSARTAGVI